VSEINFEGDDPIWEVDIEHRNPGAAPIWSRAFNAPSERRAIEKAIATFEGEGLNPVLIDAIQVWELKLIEGGEESG
jgi:hypothetical protein